ncbi:hypothetical protein V7S43_019072 [Phytophthora oleae]|uniref:Transposase IS30-like HTH domain-containing protein n=1 Tax=Phytophthora oleae TaxID=2107226 RepID=A0ABD3FFZ2_9STRA
MPRGTRLSAEEVRRAKALHSVGKSYRFIARMINRSDNAVRNVLNRKPKPSHRKKVGRPTKCTHRFVRHIFRLATVKTFTSRRISEAIDHVLKPSTMRKVLNSSRVAKWIKRKPALALKPHHKVARAKFAAKFLSRTCMWERVIFSDEKKFNLDGPDGYQYYWHDVRADLELYSKRVSGGGSVMAWAGMNTYGKTDIAFLEGRQDSKCYTDTLDGYLAPFLQNLRENHGIPDPIFQQDNASIHEPRLLESTLKLWVSRN